MARTSPSYRTSARLDEPGYFAQERSCTAPLKSPLDARAHLTPGEFHAFPKPLVDEYYRQQDRTISPSHVLGSKQPSKQVVTIRHLCHHHSPDTTLGNERRAARYKPAGCNNKAPPKERKTFDGLKDKIRPLAHNRNSYDSRCPIASVGMFTRSRGGTSIPPGPPPPLSHTRGFRA
jgi:hypothetical protein